MRLGMSARPTDEENFAKVKAAYDACLDRTAIKELGVSPLADVVDIIRKTFPVTAASSSSDAGSLKDAILFLAKYDVPAFVSNGANADDTDPDTVVVNVWPPWTIGLPSKEQYEDEKLVQKYQDALVKVLAELSPGQSKESMIGVVELEKRLAAASPSTEDREDITKTYNPMSLEEASALAPQIGLAAVVSELSPSDFQASRVILAAPEYMKILAEILESTDRIVVQNYLVWKAVQALYGYVDSETVKPYEVFVNELSGKDPNSEPERWRTCVAHIDSGLGWILSRFFVEKAFSATARDLGHTIVSDIKSEFIKKLKATEWMDEATTAKAIEKVHNIAQKVGYPTQSPDIMDPGSLADFYKTVNVTDSTYFANALSMREFAVAHEWSALGKPTDRNQWELTAPTVNAYYNPPRNEIVFPAGIMQLPVFDVDVPAFVSYGAFGSFGGHELSHAFDSSGRHYDQTGNYTDWWTEATVREFKERAQCFVDQYSNFTVPGPDNQPLHVNGGLTLGENIADAGGLSASFQAWKLRTREKPGRGLPGLDFFTQEQLFFVSYAAWWCGKSRKESAINRIYTDPHAPKWARVLGTVANSREFRESFQCKAKEPTCELW